MVEAPSELENVVSPSILNKLRQSENLASAIHQANLKLYAPDLETIERMSPREDERLLSPSSQVRPTIRIPKSGLLSPINKEKQNSYIFSNVHPLVDRTATHSVGPPSTSMIRAALLQQRLNKER